MFPPYYSDLFCRDKVGKSSIQVFPHFLPRILTKRRCICDQLNPMYLTTERRKYVRPSRGESTLSQICVYSFLSVPIKQHKNIHRIYFQNLCTRTSELASQFESPGQKIGWISQDKDCLWLHRAQHRMLANILFLKKQLFYLQWQCFCYDRSEHHISLFAFDIKHVMIVATNLLLQ